MLKKLLTSLAVGALLATQVVAQVSFTKVINVSVTGGSATWTIGVNPANTFGQDNPAPAGGVSEPPASPPPPAPFAMDLRMVAGLPGWTLPDFGTTPSTTDVRGFASASQVDDYAVILTAQGAGATSTSFKVSPVTISWPADLAQNGTAWTLTVYDNNLAQVGSAINMLSQTSVSVGPFPGGLPAGAYSIYLVVRKTGAIAPAAISFSTPPVSFGTVNLPTGTLTRKMYVSNNGSGPGTLNITAINTAGVAAPFGITAPATLTLNAGQTDSSISVTFAPTVGGSFSGSVSFTHNASGSPTSVAISGAAQSDANKLKFSQDSVRVLDNTPGYTETLSMNYVGANPLKTLQVAISARRPLVLRSVAKGSSLSSGNWSFRSQFYREPSGSEDTTSTKDSVIVTFYANDLATGLFGGAVYNLIGLTYDAANLDDPDSLYRYISLSYLVGSDAFGNDLALDTGNPLRVKIFNTTIRGDVNNDGRVDVLDLLKVVDHILLRSALTGDALVRADVAPWPAGDGKIDARDLAVLQDMILTGTYPSVGGAPRVVIRKVPALAKSGAVSLSGDLDAKLTFHVTSAGIAVRMESNAQVKGLQFDAGKIGAVAPGMKVESTFGEGYSNLNGDLLRVLVYDQSGSVLDKGTHLVANIPMAIANPAQMNFDNIVLADQNNEKLERVQIAISLDEAPEVPVEFSLKQNFPNPFNPSTDIQFSVPQAADVRIAIYNMLGQEVRTLFVGNVERGTRIARWDGRNNAGVSMPSGSYIYRMTAGSFVSTKKMLLLK
jgi:hypothetical protein